MKINNALIHNAFVEHIEFEDIKPQIIEVGKNYEFLIFEMKKNILMKDLLTNELISKINIDITSLFEKFKMCSVTIDRTFGVSKGIPMSFNSRSSLPP